ncbi:MAG: SDR family oxidoreductase [Bacteroidetes bacterium]|nr:SDR family oxidoreductase [Bacteroidota bacterium]
MSTLNQKVVLVTGASGGIGSEISRQIAKAGGKVIVHYAGRKEPAQQLADEINQGGGEAIVLQADVRKSDEVKKLFDDAIAHFGRIDVLVNTAGIMITKSLKDMTDEDFDGQFDINVKGTFNTMREAYTKLADNGNIINLSTSVNRLAVPAYSVYSATKSAVEQLTRVASKEIGRGIRVNSVSPGPTGTELYFKGKSPEIIARQAALSPFNRIGDPKEIAPIIVFLASDEARWISGQNYGVNGAMA